MSMDDATLLAPKRRRPEARLAPTTFANALVVLPDEVRLAAVTMAGGVIVEISTRPPRAAVVHDLAGDHLLPGLVEVHTDNLERHLQPRPGVDWPPAAAMMAHDLELAGAGVTTALNAICLGDTVPDGFRAGLLAASLTAFSALDLHNAGRAEHFLHLRCELTDPRCADLFDTACDQPRARLVSLMDHTPGQRQWRRLERFREQYAAKHGLSAAELDQLVAERQRAQSSVVPENRARVVAAARSHGLVLASHDDTEIEHVDEGLRNGVLISEFPTTIRAAEAARARGLAVVVGAPNVLRGGSHAGNVSALELVEAGLADILSSDYYPPALLGAVFRLADTGKAPLSAAVQLASARPAAALGLHDRGQIAVGRRADLVQVRITPAGPLVATTWRHGRRVI